MYFLDVSQNAWGLHTQADDTVDTRSRDDDDVDAQWKAQAADLRYKLGLPHAKVVWIDKALLQGVPRTPRYLETISLAWWSWRKVQKQTDYNMALRLFAIYNKETLGAVLDSGPTLSHLQLQFGPSARLGGWCVNT